ncbi:MAG: bifunctional transcriptional activator/DNA repair enzyme AdaA [Acidobacteriota bacterium]
MTATAQPAPQPPAINSESAWQQLVARDRRAPFFYAVTTTGVFCRIGCSSRRPRRENVRFFATPAEAARAGFRPCTRCKPSAALATDSHADKVRRYLEANFDRTVRLQELADLTGVSQYTVHRLFNDAMGMSPRQYQQSLRATRLRAALKGGDTVTGAIYNAGFSSSSRAYEGAPLGMSPKAYARGGKDEVIRWINGPTPFGWIGVGVTDRGICWLEFADKYQAEAALRAEFPAATLVHDPNLDLLLDHATCIMLGTTPPAAYGKIQFDLKGTAFQLRVWEALRRIPRGQTRSYSELAAELGNPKATRAVARACATNRVAVLVPCHRVIGANGSATGYRWGIERKRRLLDSERS